jgi:GDP-L-fucose synthase
MKKDSKIYVAGHTGLLGTALIKKLKDKGYENIITQTHKKLDLTNKQDVDNYLANNRPEYIFLAAARVGGIHANSSYPAQFIYENLAIQINVIHSAYLYEAKKLLFFGSACSYPCECPQPIKEEYLLSGYLEPTNEPYAVAKIAGIKMCEAYNRQYGTNFICAVPTNVYGTNDDFDPNDSHVIPALIRRFHEAKIKKQPIVAIWGSGNPRREFIYVDDLADACLFLMEHYNESEIINIGSGEEVSINELAYIIKEVIGYNGEISFDASKPDGTPRKMLDISKLKKLGWQAETSLVEGIGKTYEWYLNNFESISSLWKK